MKRQKIDSGGIDGDEGRGVRLGGSATDPLDDEEVVIDQPQPFEDYEEFSGENETAPDDRRLDPLRRSF
ncbi:MAG TPA: hypothetical protein VF980_17915 [Thermoanaerobaculia bacterium]